MSIVKKAFVDSTVKTHAIHNMILQYTAESIENKVERVVSTLNKITNVL